MNGKKVFFLCMEFSPIYAACAFVSVVAIAILIVGRIRATYYRKEIIYREVMAAQSGAIMLLSSDLYCLKIYPSLDSVVYGRLVGVGGNLLEIVGEESKESVRLTAKQAFDSNAPQTIIFRMKGNQEFPEWCKLRLQYFLNEKKMPVFACVLENINEMMRLQNVENEASTIKKILNQTAFDVFWELDVETRRLTLRNDLFPERHGTIKLSAGEYSLNAIFYPDDLIELEEKINILLTRFLSNEGQVKEAYLEQRARIRTFDSSGVWYLLAGVITRKENRRLQIYGSAHRETFPEKYIAEDETKG